MTKSMGASKNLPTAIMKPSQGASWLRVLAAELSLRLKEARDISPNLWPKVIALGVRQGARSLAFMPSAADQPSRLELPSVETSTLSFRPRSHHRYRSCCWR